MLDDLDIQVRSTDEQYDFSVIIPTWNNLAYLKLCLGSLIKNSSCRLQIIILLNEANDGSLEWMATQEGIDYIHTPKNIGICYGMNICRTLVKSEYIAYLNDDMYALPGWDSALKAEIESLDTKMFYLSSTMVEPNGSNPCVLVRDYGDDIASFQEEKLLSDAPSFQKDDWQGSTWPPSVMHVELWDLIGGYSIEFSPGMYSDPDLSLKMYEAGVRIYKGIGKSLVYHFGSKSTGRAKRNKGRDTFLLKWGMSARHFTQQYLHIGAKYDKHFELPDLSVKHGLINTLKRIQSCF